jgi:DNA-binding response OmpR family regulator
LAKQNILIVDSDPKSLRVLEVSLKKAGFSVTKAVNGVDAMEKVRLSAPDLIISDTNMTEMDGFELCTKLKKNDEWAGIPFIFLTAQKSIEDKIRGLELGVDDYLTKPIFIREILARVGLSLQRRQKERLETRGSKTKFSGNLTDMGMVDLIQTIDVSRKSGVIRLAKEGDDGEIHFREGKVIDASTRSRKGADAVYRMLVWSDGTFDIEFCSVDRDDVVELPTQGLLMEGMRRLDEWGRLQEQLPPLNAVFDVDEIMLAERLSEIPDEVNKVIKHFNGNSSLMEVLDQSEYGDLESLSIIAKLYFEGLITEITSGMQESSTDMNESLDLSRGSLDDKNKGLLSGRDRVLEFDDLEKNVVLNTLRMRPVEDGSNAAPRLSIAVRRAGFTQALSGEVEQSSPLPLPAASDEDDDAQPVFPSHVFDHGPDETETSLELPPTPPTSEVTETPSPNEADRIAAALDAEAPPPSQSDPELHEKEEYFEGEAYRAAIDKPIEVNRSVRLGQKRHEGELAKNGDFDEDTSRQGSPAADSSRFKKVAIALLMGAILVGVVSFILWKTTLVRDFVRAPFYEETFQEVKSGSGVPKAQLITDSDSPETGRARISFEGEPAPGAADTHSVETPSESPAEEIQAKGKSKQAEYADLLEKAKNAGRRRKIEFLREAVAMNPRGDEALANLATMLAESKKTRAEALFLAKRAAEINSGNAAAWLAIGYIHQLEGDKEASQKAYEKCAACIGPKMYVKECAQLIK